MNDRMPIVIRTFMVAAGAAWLLSGVSGNAADWQGDMQAGVGLWAGDATYAIGGTVWTPEGGTEQFPEKISELQFPLDVASGTLGGSLQWRKRLEFYGQVMGNLSDPETKANDSDWGVLEGSDENTLDIYSESDAELTAVAVDAGARYWFLRPASDSPLGWSLGAGPSLSYQHLDWTVSNLDQWYPSNPSWGHDYLAGTIGTYRSDMMMPALNISTILQAGQIGARMEFGAGPAFVQDKDDHILRYKRTKGDLTGVGVKAAAELRFDVSPQLFVLVRIAALYVEATGTQTQEGYGGELAGWRGTIDEEYVLTSVNGGVAVGLAF